MELPIRPRLFSPCISLPTFLSSLLPNCGFDLSDTAVAITLLCPLPIQYQMAAPVAVGEEDGRSGLGPRFSRRTASSLPFSGRAEAVAAWRVAETVATAVAVEMVTAVADTVIVIVPTV